MLGFGNPASGFYETPCIDALASEGMRFTDAYAAAPICSPSRASIMTGKSPARLHLTDFIPGVHPKNRKLITPKWQKQLPPEEVTLAESLKQAGYATGHFGKWHLNHDKNYQAGRPGDPASQGFDDVLTTHKPPPSLKQSHNKFPDDWHHVRHITERATSFIESHQDQAFFCYISHNSIHDPQTEKPSLVAKYMAKPGATKDGVLNPKQAAMLETLDASVGTVMEKLKELGIADRTIVVFTSDNGQLGPKTGAPLRGSKGDLYEGGIRVPLIIKWPGVTTAGSICHGITIQYDFFPTFNDIAGITGTFEGLDGQGIVPLLKNPTAKSPRKPVAWHYPHYHSRGIAPEGAIRSGDYKLIEWFEQAADSRADAYELYDLSKDPGERDNLAQKMPERTAALKKALEQWRHDVGAQMMQTNPEH